MVRLLWLNRKLVTRNAHVATLGHDAVKSTTTEEPFHGYNLVSTPNASHQTLSFERLVVGGLVKVIQMKFLWKSVPAILRS